MLPLSCARCDFILTGPPLFHSEDSVLGDALYVRGETWKDTSLELQRAGFPAHLCHTVAVSLGSDHFPSLTLVFLPEALHEPNLQSWNIR